MAWCWPVATAGAWARTRRCSMRVANRNCGLRYGCCRSTRKLASSRCARRSATNPCAGECSRSWTASTESDRRRDLLAAHSAHPQAAWLVVACDLPLLNDMALEALIRARDGRHAAIGYRSGHDDLPEPLCTLWEPAALERLEQQVRAGRNGLRDTLSKVDMLLLPAPTRCSTGQRQHAAGTRTAPAPDAARCGEGMKCRGATPG